MPTTTLHVPAMSCEHCRDVIQKAVARLPGHQVTSFDPAHRLIHVSADRDIRTEDLRRVLEEAGYPAEYPAAESMTGLAEDDEAAEQVLGAPSTLAASGEPAELYGGARPTDLPASATPADLYGGEQGVPPSAEASPAALYGAETPAIDWEGEPMPEAGAWGNEDQAA